jgi:tetratricopeptide (TPR) repeat protein
MAEASKLPRDEIEKLVFQGVLHARVEDYEEAAEIFATHLPVLAGGTDDDKIISASAFSYYGLCIASLYKQYSEAIEYCNVSMRVQPSNPEHYENLGKIYLLMRNRRKAIEAFFEGLEREPSNTSINRILSRIGKRREPVISFLSRDFPVNVWLGRKRHDKEMRRRAELARIRRAKQKRGKTVAADVRLKHARLRAERHRKDRQRV